MDYNNKKKSKYHCCCLLEIRITPQPKTTTTESRKDWRLLIRVWCYYFYVIVDFYSIAAPVIYNRHLKLDILNRCNWLQDDFPANENGSKIDHIKYF